MSSKGGGSTQTTSNLPPQYIQDAQQANIGLAQGLVAPFVGQAPMYSVAGLNPDQQAAFQMARQGAVGAMQQPNYSGALATMATNLPQTMVDQAGSMANVNMASYMNPYREQVVQRTLGNLSDARDRALNQNRARVGDSFRNTRAALLDSEIDRNYQRQAGDTIASLYDQGYNSASQLAQADLNRRQGALQFGVQGAMSGLGQAQSAAGQQQQMQQRALQALLGTGQMQQQQAQQALDVPFTNLQRLLQSVGTNYGQSQTTTSRQSSNPLGTILGLAAAAGGLGWQPFG